MKPRVLFAGSLLLLAAAGCGRDQAEPESWPLPLKAGQYLHVVVEQLGVDVVVTVLDPAGRLLLQVDTMSEASGPEELFLVAQETGRYGISIKTWGDAGGGERSTIHLEALRRASPADRKLAAAAAALSRARLLAKENPDGAAASYREAARLWGELGEDTHQAWAFFHLGKLYGDDPARRREGTEALARSLGLFQRRQAEREQTIVLLFLGKAWSRLDEADREGRCYEQAIALLEKLGDMEERAARLNDLAKVRVRQGRIHAAIDLYSEAVATWQRLEARKSLATTRSNLGLLYASMGESRLALDQYHRALALLEEEPNPRVRAVVLDKLGDVLLETEGPDAALARFREALELRKEQRDLRGQAVTLNSIGRAWLEAGRPHKALQAFAAAEEIFRAQGEDLSVAVVRNNLGLAQERTGRPGRARELYRQALETARARFSPQAEEAALFGLARVARHEGRLDEAERWMEQSLDRIEEVRRQVWRPDLRSAFHAARQEQYVFLIDLLAERHRHEPRGGHAARAFAVAERARARSLLDLLSAARHQPGAEELRRLDGLSRRINERHRELLAVASQGIADGLLEQELTGLLESLRQGEAAVEGPRLASRTIPPTLSLHEVQTGLLDEETLFLEYFLGEERSYLWAVTPETVRLVTTLPGREEIEATARRTWERMTESHQQTGDVAARQAAARLSRIILGPVADLLGRRRLVVVAPGALQIVPFAALPDPASGESAEPRPLILDHEIVSLPSASVLGALRAQIAGRRPPSGLVAVVADPVLGPDDERLRALGPVGHGNVMPEGRTQAAARSRRSPSLDRLPFAGREAEAILSLAGAAPVLAASGFAASRDLVQSGRLRGYRTLHFATHSLYNNLHPELSALALSTFDSSGRPVDGHLRAYEVSSLDLDADLVVLSACRTALGKEVGGEGLVGLTQGFLHAGVPRLIVSLWDVDDRATSELMKRFYTALLEQGLPPAQALRQAQISLLREDRWSAPYHWAGFILQGEWRSSRQPNSH